MGCTPSSIASRPPWTTVIGVRNSCVTSASIARRSSRDRSRRSAMVLNEAARPRTGRGPRTRTRTPGSPSARRSVASAISASGRTADPKTRIPARIASTSTTSTATAVTADGVADGARKPSREAATHVARVETRPTSRTRPRTMQPTIPAPPAGPGPLPWRRRPPHREGRPHGAPPGFTRRAPRGRTPRRAPCGRSEVPSRPARASGAGCGRGRRWPARTSRG